MLAQRQARNTPGREKAETLKDIPAQKQQPEARKELPVEPQRTESATDLDGLLAEAKAAIGVSAKQNNEAQKPRPNEAVPNAMKPIEAPVPKRTATPNENGQSKPSGAHQVAVSGTTPVSKQTKALVDSPELGEIRDEAPANKAIGECLQRTASSLSSRTSTQVSPAKEKNAQSFSRNQPATQSAKPNADNLRSAPQSHPETPLATKSAQPRKNNEEQQKAASISQEKSQPATKSSLAVDTPRSVQAVTTSTNGAPVETTGSPICTDMNNVPAKPKTITSSRRTSIQQEQDGRDEERALIRHEASMHEQSLDPAPKNAAAYSHYFDDLDEWLEVTGYHDVAYRQRHLQRQRTLMELDAQRARIEQEAQQDEVNRTSRARTQSVQVQSVRPVESNRSSSALAMPPPPRPTSIVNPVVPTAPRSQNNIAPHTPVAASVTGTKRLRSPPTGALQERAEKVQRTSSVERSVQRKDSGDRPTPSGKVLQPQKPR